jgi:tetratricopeptide (TPR) repeat protein
MPPEEAAAQLETAEDRAHIFGLLLRAVRSRAGYAALLSVHTEGLRVQRAIGDERFECDQVAELRLPRGVVPAFEEAIESGFPYIGPIATGNPDIDLLLRRLGDDVVPAAVMVLPVLVESRTVALLVGHSGPDPIAKEEVPDLYPLLTASGRALRRFLASRAGAVAAKPGRRASTAGIDGVTDEITALRRVLEIYRQYESWEELADALRTLIRRGMETGDPDEDQQLELLIELGTVEADQLDRPDLAVEAWRSALTIDAGERRVLDALERLFASRERWDDMVELLERRAALADELPERIGLLLNAAAFAADRLGDTERAVELYERIRGWEPTHELATSRLEVLYRVRGDWQPLAALLVDLSTRHEDERARARALETAAEIYEQELRDFGAAFLVWMAVLRQEPERAGIVESLARLAPRARAWEEILPECETLAEELEAEHPVAAARLWHQIGRWHRDHLDGADAAAAMLDRAVQLDPSEIEAVSELVVLRRQVGPPAELARALARCADLELDPLLRAEVRAELGELEESALGRADDAIDSYERALADDPGCRPAAQALRRLVRATGDWDRLASVLARHAAALGDDAPRAELADLHSELGEVLASHLGRTDDAIAAFKTALELDARNAGALQGLKQIYRASGQRETYLETVEAELDASASPDPASYAELAAEWEARERLDRAAGAWEKVLAIDPRNQQAHQGLARVFRQLGRWVALAAACRSHLKVVEGGARVPVLLDMASVLESGLGDVEGAIRACQEVLTLEAENPAALDALARLNERVGRWNEALEALARLKGKDERERADLRQRAGRIHASRGELASALTCLEEAISLDPRNAAAHAGIGRVQRERGDFALATHHLVRAAQLSAGPADAVRCLIEAAEVYRDELSDQGKARECLERALELEPEHKDTKAALSELLTGSGNWTALWPHLEQMVEKIQRDPDAVPVERREVFARAARCALEIGEGARSLELYDLALAADPGDVATLLARADALYRSGDRDQAARAYNSVLVQHAPTLERGQSVAVYRRLALIQKELGRATAAAAFYHKALELDPKHRETLEDVIGLEVGRERYDEAIGTLRTLAEAVPEERAAVIERIGDLYRDKLNNTARASSTYLQALEVDPKNRRVLQKLLDVQSDAGQWKFALDTIGRFIELESEPRRRGKYILAAAAIRRTKLQDVAGALVDYERALDAFFDGGGEVDATARTRALEAFQGIDEILTSQKDWKRQERAYRKVIKRLPMGDPVLLVLWQALGEIYRSRLDDYQSAIVAFETAHALDPAKQPERVQIIAELYARVGTSGGGEDLTERARRLVEADPMNPDAYRALGRACMDAGRLDETWCVCRALVFLKQANPAEQEMYKKYEEHERRKAKGILDEEAWKLVRDPAEDQVISSVFALVWEGPVALRAGPPKSFELKESEKLKVEDSSRVMSKIFQSAARVLGAPLPLVYVQPNRSGRLLLANVIDGKRFTPTMIVGRDLMTGYRDTEVAFAVASTVSLLRPAYYLRLTLPAIEELELALAAASTVGGKPVRVRTEVAQAAGAFAAEIQKRLTPQTQELLSQLVARLPERPDLLRWRNAVDSTARRAGLLICGELAAAGSMIASEPAHPAGPRPADKVRELVVYSVSASYFAARRHLGVNVA